MHNIYADADGESVQDWLGKKVALLRATQNRLDSLRAAIYQKVDEVDGDTPEVTTMHDECNLTSDVDDSVSRVDGYSGTSVDGDNGDGDSDTSVDVDGGWPDNNSHDNEVPGVLGFEQDNDEHDDDDDFQIPARVHHQRLQKEQDDEEQTMFDENKSGILNKTLLVYVLCTMYMFERVYYKLKS